MSRGESASYRSVAVLIVNYNSGIHLKRCIDAVKKQTLKPKRVLVVDNASTDGSSKGITELMPILEWVPLRRNVGFAAANNIAISRVDDCDWVALLNPDAFPTRQWLAALTDAAERNPEYTMFASRLLMAKDPEYLDGAGDVYHVSGLAWRRGYGCRAEGKYLREQEIFSPCAAAAMYHRSTVVDSGGFDEGFFCYSEDVDLGFRLRLAGQRCLYVPDAVVHHVGSSTTGVRSDFSVYYGHRNYVWTFFKNMPVVLLWICFIPHLLMNLGSVVRFALRGKGRVILRAKYDAIRGLPSIWRKRKGIQTTRTVSMWTLWQQMSKGWPTRRQYSEEGSKGGK